MIHPTEDINEILALHFSNEKLTEEQETLLMSWMIEHKDEYNKLSKVIDSSTFDTQQAWAQVQPRLYTPKVNPKPTMRIWTKRVLSLAASVVLIVGLSLYFVQHKNDEVLHYANASDVLETVVLPDSSTLVLYPQTQVTYQATAERKVELNGKAFFAVRRNEQLPFTVQSNGTEVRVLGTSFLVSNKDTDGTDVFVKDGRVQVTAATDKVVLHTNEQAQVSSNGIDKTYITQPEVVFAQHITQRLYTQTPLSEVVSDIEKEFHVVILLDSSLQNARIHASIKFVHTEDVLNELAYICNAKYEKLSDTKYKLYKH